VRLGQSSGADEVGVAGLRPANAQVVGDGAVEEQVVLEDRTQVHA
jgi:hypothetical protein